MILIIWSLVIAAIIWLYFRKVYSRFAKFGVKTLPLIPPFGHLRTVLMQREHLVEMITRTYSSFPEERFIGFYEFINPVINIHDLELIKKITVKDYEMFLDHRSGFDEDADPFFGKNLLSLKGQKWKDMRSTLSPAFTSSKIRLMIPFMIDVGNHMVDSVKRQITSSDKSFVDLDARDLVNRYANDVIASCAFGLKVDSHTEVNNEFFKRAKDASTFKFSQLVKFVMFTAFPRIMKKLNISLFTEANKRFFKNLVLDTMNERLEKNIKRNDLIHLLMEAKKGQLHHEESNTEDAHAGFATVHESEIGLKKVNRVWSDEELVAQAVLFFIAGFDTVSTALVFLMHELAVNPDIQERLYREIKKTQQENEGKLDYQTIQHMKYLDMVVSESLRLWSPAVAIDRLCKVDYNLGKPNKDSTEDYIIRKGEGISIPVWAIHRNPKYFPNPEKFDPERFSEENKHEIQPFTYFPFGLGPRNCIGSRFALCEVKVMIYQLILELELEPCEKTCIPVVIAKHSFNIYMKGGHWIRFKQRLSN